MRPNRPPGDFRKDSKSGGGSSGQFGAPRKQDGPRVNEQIRSPEIRLIGDDGKAYGVVTIYQARLIAQDTGLDLIEVSPTATPPVVKLMDFGKYKYQLQKKLSEAKKKQVVVDIKELKLRPNIEKHDLEVKLRSVKKFFEDGDKVKVTMQFRGRELSHRDLCEQQFQAILEQVTAQGGVIESQSRLMGNKIIALFNPEKKK